MGGARVAFDNRTGIQSGRPVFGPPPCRIAPQRLGASARKVIAARRGSVVLGHTATGNLAEP